MPLTFPKSIHLHYSSEFLRVKTEGRAFGGRYFTLGVLKDREATRTGLITSKRVGIAVERNRVRRRLRELMRLSLPEWTPGVWVVAIARRAAVKASFTQLQGEWTHLARRAGILQKTGGETSQDHPS
ncbi:MAG: ribonuclease P protein component [Chthoniobacteraceae bacterium]